jgi:antitoxin PrlF
MKLAESRITAQGQVSVPAEVRRRLGLVPGSTIEWDVEGSAVVVRRAQRHTSEELHHVLFPEADAPPKRRPLSALKEGIRDRMRRRARG